MSSLCWKELAIDDAVLAAGSVDQGEVVRLLAPISNQLTFIDRMTLYSPKSWQMWMQTAEASYCAGTDEFFEHAAVMLHDCGYLTNLTLRENLLLPFLYGNDRERLQEAEARLEDISAWLGFADRLDMHPGSDLSRSLHHLVSLGRCVLERPDIIVIQDVHFGLRRQDFESFRQVLQAAFAQMKSGILYLTDSETDRLPIEYNRTIELEWRESAIELR